MILELKIKNNKIFSPLKQKWLVKTPEEEIRQKYIVRLVNDYGYSLNQMEQEVLVSNTKRGTGGARADIIIYKTEEDQNNRKNAFIVVECKADNIQIQKEDYYQGANYASMANADFVVTTNLKETKIFKNIKEEIPNLLEEIKDLPNANLVNDPQKVEVFLKQTKAFTRDEFSKLLLNCHNILRNNDKLSPEAAFDEISKILFIKIRYERQNSYTQIFSNAQFLELKKAHDETKLKTNLPFYHQLFERTKEDFINDDIFDVNETIRIRENSFEAIVKQLEIYNLSTTPDDIKGIAFENFLGKTFRGELGQFFTPRTIVDFMVEVLDPQEGERICDPCCGSGGFLIKTFEYIRTQIENEIHEQKQKIKQKYYTHNFDKLTKKKKEQIDEKVNAFFNKLNQELNINNEKSRLNLLYFDCIFGTDANPRMSRIAKMNMIMHGDGHSGVYHHDGLLNVHGIFENRFDIILTNPPFGAKVEKMAKITEADKYTNHRQIEKYKKRYGQTYINALKQVNNNVGKSLLSLYKTSSMSRLTEILFIERCLNLLKPGGRMGIVVPEGFLNNSRLQKVRDFVESQAKILLIVSLPRDVFMTCGATVKTSLLFLKKFTEKEAQEWNRIAKKVKQEIEKKYTLQKSTLSLRAKSTFSAVEKRTLRKEIKQIEQQIATETQAKIKSEFDYPIPIAEVEKAGINSTGTIIENELIPLSKEFLEYHKQNPLWITPTNTIKYEVSNSNSWQITRN